MEKNLLQLLLLFVSACTTPIQAVPVITPISVTVTPRPSSTETSTPIPPTPTPIPTEKPFDYLQTIADVKANVEKKCGCTYAEFLKKEFPNDQETNSVIWDGLQYVSSMVDAVGLEVVDEPITRKLWRDMGYVEAKVLYVAVAEYPDPIPVITGFYDRDGKYVAILSADSGEYLSFEDDTRLDDPATVEKVLVGKHREFRFIGGFAGWPQMTEEQVWTEKPGQEWSQLDKLKDVRSPEAWEIIVQAVMNPDSFPSKVLPYTINPRRKEIPSEIMVSNGTIPIKMWAYLLTKMRSEHGDAVDPWLWVDMVGDASLIDPK